MNVDALQDRAVELVMRERGERRLRAALAAALALGFCLGIMVEESAAPLAITAALVGGIAYRLSR